MNCARIGILGTATEIAFLAIFSATFHKSFYQFQYSTAIAEVNWPTLKTYITTKVVKNIFLTRHEIYNINSDCKLES